MKIYVVSHVYDVDGGFGDAIEEKTNVAMFSDENEAKKFVEHWQKPHVYERPYDDLWCGELVIDSYDAFSNADETKPKDPWWLYSEEYDEEDDDD